MRLIKFLLLLWNYVLLKFGFIEATVSIISLTVVRICEGSLYYSLMDDLNESSLADNFPRLPVAFNFGNFSKFFSGDNYHGSF